ncbi:MAG: MFS transporter [Ferroplasma sp.]|uniref:MFS transporter n=1 Tax=Ferroplasma sp. TaxID=2591003 RepID=UPI0028167385|nr:MFS transporter [Ferroplasma sp.]WMT50723.1 MAG: MFS transporter [Ferroplasma sp.]
MEYEVNNQGKGWVNAGSAIIVLLLFSIMAASNVTAPIYELYAIKYNFGPFIITDIFGIYVLMLIPSLLFWGQYSDKHGRKLPVGIGVIMEIIGLLSFLFARNMYMLFIGRAFMGLASGAIAGPASALLFHYHRKAGAVLTSIGTSAGTATGPLIGGLMAQYLPYPLRLVYLVSIVFVLIPAMAMYPLKDTSPKNPMLKLHFPSIDKDVIRMFLLSSFAAFIAWSITAFFMSLAPVYIITLSGINNIAMGGIIVFIMLGIASVFQIVSLKFKIKSSMVTGMAFIALAILFILISIMKNSLYIFIIGTVFAGMGQGFAFTGATREIKEISPADKTGDMLANYYIIIYLGVGLPVIILGFMDRITGLFNGILYYGIAFIVFSIIMGILLTIENFRD